MNYNNAVSKSEKEVAKMIKSMMLQSALWKCGQTAMCTKK